MHRHSEWNKEMHLPLITGKLTKKDNFLKYYKVNYRLFETLIFVLFFEKFMFDPSTFNIGTYSIYIKNIYII